MIRIQFFRLRAGDVVLLTNPNRSDVPQNVTVTIVDVSFSTDYGWCIRVGDEVDYFEEDGYTIELLHYANGLPDASFFTWTDPDAGPRIAIRLQKNMWSVDDRLLSHSDTIALVNGAETRALTVRD